MLMKLKNKMFLMEKGTCCFGGKSSTSQMANGVVEALQRQLPLYTLLAAFSLLQ
jgi:hypothetical protein